MRYQWEALNNAWNQQVLGYNPQRQKALLQRLKPLPDLAISLTLFCCCCPWPNLAVITGWRFIQNRLDLATRLWHKKH